MQQTFGFTTQRHNRCCKDCFCDKADPILNMCNMTKSAPWRRTEVKHEAYMANTPIHQRSPLLKIPGMRHDRCKHDVMHGQALGTGQHVNGNCILILAQEGHWGNPADGLHLNLRRAHRDFKQWYKINRLACSCPRWTEKTVTGNSKYPEMDCKESCD